MASGWTSDTGEWDWWASRASALGRNAGEISTCRRCWLVFRIMKSSKMCIFFTPDSVVHWRTVTRNE